MTPGISLYLLKKKMKNVAPEPTLSESDSES